MRRVEILVILIVALLGCGRLALAQEAEQVQGASMYKAIKKDEVQKHHKGSMIKEMLMKKHMVALEDGGIVVMVGNKLIKYDKDLNLMKEVELEMDFEAMHKMMEKMKEKCSKYRQVKEEEGEEEGEIVELDQDDTVEEDWEEVQPIEGIEVPEEALQ
ncbi:MAG: hypothetical protein PVI33_03250 [Candidatus Omnitrophota bacterium]|jgi:hypothetical protein